MTTKDKLSISVFVTLIVATLLMVGCTSKEEARQQTKHNFQTPELVQENTPKGKLWRVEIIQPGGAYSHWVYWFDNSSNTISVNYSIPSGKSHVNQSIVIDGVEYIPKEKNEK
jgi:hypothetical protein